VERVGAGDSGADLHESGDQKAERMAMEEMKGVGRKNSAIRAVGQLLVICHQYFSQSWLARTVLSWGIAPACLAPYGSDARSWGLINMAVVRTCDPVQHEPRGLLSRSVRRGLWEGWTRKKVKLLNSRRNDERTKYFRTDNVIERFKIGFPVH